MYYWQRFIKQIKMIYGVDASSDFEGINEKYRRDSELASFIFPARDTADLLSALYPDKDFSFMYTDWRIPPKLAYMAYNPAVWRFASDGKVKVLSNYLRNEAFLDLKELNPEAVSNLEEHTAPFDILHGMLSKFNFEDIKFYGLRLKGGVDVYSDDYLEVHKADELVAILRPQYIISEWSMSNLYKAIH